MHQMKKVVLGCTSATKSNSESEGFSSEIDKSLPTFKVKNVNRIFNLSHLGKSLKSILDHQSICHCDGSLVWMDKVEWKGNVTQFRCIET